MAKAFQKSSLENEGKTNVKLKNEKFFCEAHEEKLKLFCFEDETLTCVICRDSAAHSGHSFAPVKEAVTKYKEKLKIATDALELKRKHITELQLKQEGKISYIQDITKSLKENITEEFARLYQFLQGKEQQLVQQLNEEANGILEKMKKSLNEIQKMAGAIQTQISGIHLTLRQEDALHFLSSLKNETERNKDSQEVKTDAVELVSDDLSLGVYKGPLQYKVWKEMLSILIPGLSHLNLDPNTAQPHLILSEDLTSVRLGDIRQQLPNNPERFDFCVSVLGSEGFTTGRHYWEVAVGNKTNWDVGVTTESSNRRGSVIYCPENGYWVLMLRNENEYDACESTSKSLTLTVKLHRIGVYLDYEGGQVSLYNADNMSHIYTFTDTFTERVYPYFSPYLSDGGKNAEPLKLFHLKL